MWLAHPIWLLAVLPWAVAVLWLLRGRTPPSLVPFLSLWRGLPVTRPQSRAWRVPPRSVVAALLAALLAILAAAGPQLGLAGSSAEGEPPLTLIVDRGITMSGPDPSAPHYRALGRQVASVLTEAADGRWLRAIAVPGGPQAELSVAALPDWLDQLAPTALDTRQAVREAVQRHRSAGPVVVITTAELDRLPDVVRLAPRIDRHNTSIASLAVRGDSPRQMMVRLQGRPPRGETQLELKTDGGGSTHTVRWPEGSDEVTAFIDLPGGGGTVSAAIVDPPDAVAADDRAWLSASPVHPRIEIRDPVAPQVVRVASAYGRARPATDDSGVILVLATPGDGEPPHPAVIAATGPYEQPPAGAAASITDHPVTRHVGWPEVLSTGAIAPAPQGWTPLLTVDGRAAVAQGPGARRQLWVGIDSSAWARSTDFVIFWTQVFDWLPGDDAGEMAARPPQRMDGSWTSVTPMPEPAPEPGEWPGLYRGDDGRVVAVSAAAVPLLPDLIEAQQWQGLAELARPRRRSLPLAPWLAAAAVLCLLVAATAWSIRT